MHQFSSQFYLLRNLIKSELFSEKNYLRKIGQKFSFSLIMTECKKSMPNPIQLFLLLVNLSNISIVFKFEVYHICLEEWFIDESKE